MRKRTKSRVKYVIYFLLNVLLVCDACKNISLMKSREKASKSIFKVDIFVKFDPTKIFGRNLKLAIWKQ